MDIASAVPVTVVRVDVIGRDGIVMCAKRLKIGRVGMPARVKVRSRRRKHYSFWDGERVG